MSDQISTVPVGRGISYPFRFSGGGVAPNIPDKPDAREVISGIIDGVRFILTWPRGTAFMKRTGGISAQLLLFDNVTDATADMIVREASAQLAANIDYASIGNFLVSFDRESIQVQMSVRPAFSSSEQNIRFNIPTTPIGA